MCCSLVLVAVCLTACHKNADKAAASGSAAPPAPAPAPAAAAAPGHGVIVHAKLTVSGAVTGTAEYTVKPDAASCADYAAKFEMPQSNDAKLGNGQSIVLSDSPEKYHGPGTYTAAELDQASATLSVNDSDEPYQPLDKGSTRSLTVNADGSGTYAFASWLDPGSKVVSGTLTWTCGS